MPKKLLIDQNVNNLDLIIAMKTMQAEPSPQKQTEFINIMIHTSFLCPAVLNPDPEVNEKGEMEIDQQTKIMFSTVSSADKKSYIVAFTDKKEAEKNKRDDNHHTVVTTYMDLCNILLKRENPYEGFVINPFSENIVLTKEIMTDINKKIRVIPMGNPGMMPNGIPMPPKLKFPKEKSSEETEETS